MLLTSHMHEKLNLEVVEMLRKKDIHSVLDFLRMDSKHIEKYSSLTFPEITEIKKYFAKTYSAPPVNGLSLYQKLLVNSRIIPTGIKELDSLLHGGLFTGTLYEFCSTAESKRLQFIMTILSNIIPKEDQVYFIDTKRDFSAKFIKDKLLRKMSKEETIENLEKVHIINVLDKYELITALYQIKSQLNNTKLIIIHSLSTLFLTKHNPTENNNILNHLANILRYLAVEYNIVVVISNLITTWIERDSLDVKEKLVCGKFWKSVANVRVQIDQKAEGKFELKLMKFNNVISMDRCEVEVDVY